MTLSQSEILALIGPPVRTKTSQSRDRQSVTIQRFSREMPVALWEMGVEAVRVLAYEEVAEEIERQARIGNEATTLRVDGRVGAPISAMKRKVTVTFGLGDARPVMNRVKSIVDQTTGTAHRWVPGRGVQLDGSGPVNLGLGQSVLLVSGDRDLPIRNIYYKFGFGSDGSAAQGVDYQNPGLHFGMRNEGFVASAARQARQAALPEFHVRASFRRGERLGSLSRFAIARGVVREAYRPGTVAFILTRSVGKQANGRRRG